jgi:hypothetical protein
LKYFAAIAALLMVHVSMLLVLPVLKILSPPTPPPLKITVISRGSVSYDGRYVWWVQDVLHGSPARGKPPLTSNNQDH